MCDDDETVEDAARKGFRLAPKTYNLDRDDRDETKVTEGQSGSPAQLLDELPLCLVFRAEAAAHGGQVRQSWFCEEAGQWNWRLTVESSPEGPTAILTATPRSEAQDAQPLAWRNRDPWRFFSTNRLHPDERQPPRFRMTVVVESQ